ncbi:helix-turn-helix domain-containing protein [Streptomyces lydicus]
MTSKDRLTRQCPNCGEEFTRRSAYGRPPRYCTDACRAAAFRNKSTHGAAAAPADHDADVARIAEATVRRAQQLNRQTRTFDPAEPLGPLELYAALLQDVEDLGAVLVRQAREYGARWGAVGEVLHTSGDSARARWPADRVERILEHRAKRGNRPRRKVTGGGQAAVSTEGSPPQLLSSFLSDLQRGSGKSARALAREVGVSPSFVSRLLNGERRPSWNVAERLTRACDGDVEVVRMLWNKECGPASDDGSQREDLTGAATLMQAAMQGMDRAVGQLHGFTQNGSFEPSNRHMTSFAWPVAHAHAAVVQGQPDEVCALWDRLNQLSLSENDQRLPSVPPAGQQPPTDLGRGGGV